MSDRVLLRCETCNAFDARTKTCRAGTPVVIPQYSGQTNSIHDGTGGGGAVSSYPITVWPAVKSEDWCRKWNEA